MPRPKAYCPEQGYTHQIFCRNQQYDRSWEHCDYAKGWKDKNYLISNYRQAYGAGWQFKTEQLPQKYWKEK